MKKDHLKESQAKLAIAIWFIYGTYLLFSGTFHGLFPMLIYYFIGMFVAAIASIATYIIQATVAKALRIPLRAFYFNILMLDVAKHPLIPTVLAILTSILNWWWITTIANIFIRFVN